MNAINKISEKDQDFATSLIELLEYLSTTYSDKYQNSPIRTEGIIYECGEGSKGFNIGNSIKYLSRYNTKGFTKSENPQDLQKAIHYILFELTRINKGKSNA